MDDATADTFSVLYLDVFSSYSVDVVRCRANFGRLSWWLCNGQIGCAISCHFNNACACNVHIFEMYLISHRAMLHLFKGASHNQTVGLLLSTGFLLGGPANLISTAISADLGTHESLRGNTAALATVTGIIDGTGSVGAAIVQYLVGHLANCHPDESGSIICTWDPVFTLLEVGGCLSCICLAPLIWHEALNIWRKTYA